LKEQPRGARSKVDAQEHARNVRDLVHEFNNQLFVIGGHCELLALQLEPGSRAHADLAAILDATDRASELAAEMRALAVAHAQAATGADADVESH
jgi:nitrogen-specific signal transduction histidine kinase